MLDYQELALQAVEDRREGRLTAFSQIAYELETALGARTATQMIQDAQRELVVALATK